MGSVGSCPAHLDRPFISQRLCRTGPDPSRTFYTFYRIAQRIWVSARNGKNGII